MADFRLFICAIAKINVPLQSKYKSLYPREIAFFPAILFGLKGVALLLVGIKAQRASLALKSSRSVEAFEVVLPEVEQAVGVVLECEVGDNQHIGAR